MEKKGACGNVPTSQGLPEIWGPFLRKKKAPAATYPQVQGFQKIQKLKIIKIKIHSAQIVGKVWISRKKTFPAPFGAIPGNFLRGPENPKILPIFLGGIAGFWQLLKGLQDVMRLACVLFPNRVNRAHGPTKENTGSP